MHLIGRNEPCHCGSGKKYKKCCLDRDSSNLEQGKPPSISTNQQHIEYSQHDITKGMKDFALAQLERLHKYLSREPVMDVYVASIASDLLNFTLAEDMTEYYLEAWREVMILQGSQNLFWEIENMKQLAPRLSKLSTQEKRLLRQVSQSLVGEYAALTFATTADHEACRLTVQFCYEAILKGIPDYPHIGSAVLTAQTGRLVNWQLQEGNGDYLRIIFNELDILHNQFESYTNSLHGLEESSIKHLATALYQEANIPSLSADKMSYTGLFNYYAGIFEQELRIIIAANKGQTCVKPLMWKEILLYLESNYVPYVADELFNFAYHFKDFHVLRNKAAHGEWITYEEFTKVKNFAINRQALSHISSAKVHFEDINMIHK